MAANKYRGTIPTITKAYENDYRTQLSQAALKLGTSTAPVAGGNWAYADGLARVGQALAGAWIDNKTQAEYADREKTYMDALKLPPGLQNDAPAAPAAPDPATALGGAPGVNPPAPAPGVPSATGGAMPGGLDAPAAALAAPNAPPPAPAGPPALPGAPSPSMPAPPQPYAPPPVLAEGDATSVSVPGMEKIQPLIQAPVERPQAPALPAPVQSASMQYAQQLLNSGNPDLAVLGQTYLEQGLKDTTEARGRTSEQQFQQGQTGYTADLNDYTGARSDARGAAVQERADAQQRNFLRYQTYTGQRFEAGQNERNRDNAYAIALLGEEGADRRANARTRNERNPYWDTPTGLKMREAANKEVTTNQTTIDKLKKYQELNTKVSTGGITGLIPLRGVFDKDYADMESIGKETTMDMLGGLGVAISDADRNFAEGTGVQSRNPQQANRNIAQVKINALNRKSERALAFGDAQANSVSQRTFDRTWKRYVDSNSVAILDKNGNVKDTYVPFDVWLSDQQGKVRRVNK